MAISCDCSVTDFDADRCYARAIRKARNEHACCECDEPIKPGQRYEDAKGIDYDGFPYRYRTCLPCVAIRSHYCPHGWLWGGLAETIEPCIGFDYRLPPSEIPNDEEDT